MDWLPDPVRLGFRRLYPGSQHGCSNGAATRGSFYRRLTYAFRSDPFRRHLCLHRPERLDGELSRRLAGITTITQEQIKNAGVTGILETVPSRHHTIALEAYNDSLRVCFQVALVVSCLCIFGGLSMEWRSVKKQKESSSAQEF